MQIGGESNLALLMIFAIGGLIVGALLMYLVLNAIRGQKDASEVVHTQPIPKSDVDKEKLDVEVNKPDGNSQDEVVDNHLEEASEPNTSNVEEQGNPDENDMHGMVVNGNFPDLRNEFSFWRSQDGGKYLIKMDETWHENIQSMGKDQVERFQKDLQIGASWLGLSLQPEIQVPGAVTTLPAVNEAIQAKIPVNRSSLSNKLDVPKRKMSIVEQVDEILQEILHEEGLYDVNIRLTEMVNRGLVVWVGKEFFEGIDAVPDPKVKDYIRQAVKRWEASGASI